MFLLQLAQRAVSIRLDTITNLLTLCQGLPDVDSQLFGIANGLQSTPRDIN